MAKKNDSIPRAVLMGDIVGSERVPSVEVLHHHFNLAVDRANRQHPNTIISPLTITLGDEFQGLISSLRDAAIIAQEMRHYLLESDIECRFVVGLVDIKTTVNKERAWNMMGPGLADARERLGEKKAESLYRFSLPGHKMTEMLLEAVGVGLTSIERRWTKTQLNDIARSLEGKSAADIAKIRNVTVHSVYKAKSGGEFDFYMIQWNAILTALSDLDNEIGGDL
jgi:hypothetical protein